MSNIASYIEHQCSQIREGQFKNLKLNAFQRSVCAVIDAVKALTAESKVPFEVEIERWHGCGLSTLLTLLPFQILTLNDETVHLSKRWDCTGKVVMLDLQSRIHYNPDVFEQARGIVVFRLRDEQVFEAAKPKLSLKYVSL